MVWPRRACMQGGRMGCLQPLRAVNLHTGSNLQLLPHLLAACTGYSLRYGIGVAHADHAAFLQHIGLEPDVDAQG